MSAGGSGVRDQRGVAGVEVALLLTLVALVVIAAVQVLGHNSGSKIGTAGRAIHQDTTDAGGGGGSGGGGSGDGGSGDTLPVGTATTPAATTAPPATTTAPPATTAPPTTVPRTTTTTSTTTTTTPPPVASGSLADGAGHISGTTWNATATAQILDQGGRPVAGATVTVTVRTRRINANGSSTWLTSTVTLTSGPDGSVDLATGPYRRNGNNRIAELQYVIAGVDLPGDGTWDGTSATLAITAP